MTTTNRDELILAHIDGATRYGLALRRKYGLASFMDRDDAAQIATECLVRAADYALAHELRGEGMTPLMIHFVRQRFVREIQKARGYRVGGPRRDTVKTGEADAINTAVGATTGRRDYQPAPRLVCLGEDLQAVARDYAAGRVFIRPEHREELAAIVRQYGYVVTIDVRSASLVERAKARSEDRQRLRRNARKAKWRKANRVSFASSVRQYRDRLRAERPEEWARQHELAMQRQRKYRAAKREARENAVA